jgi:hypothetical protein
MLNIFLGHKKLMSKIRCLIYACLILGFFLPIFSYAESVDNYLQFGISTQNFGYKEYDDQGVLLDREDGPLPGVVVELGKNRQFVSGALRFEIFDGLVDYDGQTQSGIPIVTKTDERITTIEALLRIKVKRLAKNEATIFTGLGHREWRRNIRATNITSSLFEAYRWTYFTVGGAATFWRHGKWSGGIDVRWLRPIRPTMSLDIPGYDEATLALGSRNSGRINLPFQFIAEVDRQWTITPYWELWRLGRSADKYLTVGGVPTGLVAHEPRSETNLVGVTVSLRL